MSVQVRIKGDRVPSSSTARAEKIKKELATGNLETHRVTLKDQPTLLPVIRLRIKEDVVLNHNSHRIKAQLESDPQARSLLDADPESADAQEAIAAVLRATAGFSNLKRDLSERGQQEPGLVTAEGKLVNANTRAVALGDLGEEFIDVAVLPEAIDAKGLADVELSLQVAQDFRQPYSFTNELLFVDELVTDFGLSEQDVAVRLRLASGSAAGSGSQGVKLVQQKVRILALIREIQKLGEGGPPLTFFDDCIEALQQLDSEYQRLLDSDPKGASALRSSRILAILSGVGYLPQRQLDSMWAEDYLSQALEEDTFAAEFFGAVAASSSLPAEPSDGGTGKGDAGPFAFGDSPEEDAEIPAALDRASALLAASAEEEELTVSTPDGVKTFNREFVVANLRSLITTAVDVKKRDASAGSKLSLPAAHASNAAKSLKDSLKALNEVSSDPSFDPATLQEAVAAADRALTALKDSLVS